jgi:hypothetical protein
VATESIDCKPLFRCPGCKNIKDYDEFPKDSSRCTGISSRCKLCKYKVIKNDNGWIKEVRQIIERNRNQTPRRKARQFFQRCYQKNNL